MPAQRIRAGKVGDDGWAPCPIEDLPCLLNLVQASTLAEALAMLPARVRLRVAMAVPLPECRDVHDLIYAIDLAPRLPGRTGDNLVLTSMQTSFHRWMRREFPMPLGIAFRLEKAFGVPASLLCEWYI